MTVENPQRKTLFFLNRLVWVTNFCTISLGLLGPLVFTVYVDFPCLVSKSPDQGCLSVREAEFYRLEDPPEAEIPNTFEVFLTTRGAYTSGGGCFHDQSSGSPISVLTHFGEIRLEAVQDRVLVDGQPLVPGESLSKVRYLHWNPWAVSFLEMENVGSVQDCPSIQSPALRRPTRSISGERTVLLGEFGTRFSLGKGLFVLLTLTAFGVILSRLVRNVDRGN